MNGLFFAMHIPDGFLTLPVCAVGWILALAFLIAALRWTKHSLGERQVPLLGVMAAFVFAAQAINFPVAGGTSGHLLGGALAAIVLGPWAAALVMATVIAMQGLLFQDGGLLVMGWNVLNMGILTAFSGYAVYRLILRLPFPAARLCGAVLGAWISVEVGAVATALELAASGSAPLSLAMPAMAGVHALIGIGEALITASAVALLAQARPQLLAEGAAAAGGTLGSVVAGGMGIALGVALCSPWGSTLPDGLERVSQALGFEHLGRGAAQYGVWFIASPTLGMVVAVAAGVLGLFGVWVVVGRMLGRG